MSGDSQIKIGIGGTGKRRLSMALAGHLLLGILYIWAIPPFEGPDEPQHFAYIQWLAEGKGAPPQGDAAWETPIEQEAGQPPLYYWLASIPARFTGLVDPPAVYRENPHFIAPLPRDVLDNDNRAVHHPGDESPLSGGWLALALSRGIPLLFSLVLVMAIFGLAQQAFPGDGRFASDTALLVAFIPQVLAIGAVASNDIPATAASAVVLWLATVTIRKGTSLSRAIGLGIALGLATLFKISALTLILPVAIALIWPLIGGRPVLDFIRFGLIAAAGFLATAGWWFFGNWSRFGSPLGISTHDRTPWAIGPGDPVPAFSDRWAEVGRSFWIALGWGTIRPPGWVYLVFLIFTVASLVGLGKLLLGWWRGRRSRLTSRSVLYVALIAGILANAIFLEWWMHRVNAPYGRLLFPAIGGLAVLLVSGWQAIHPRLSLLAIGFTVAVALWAPLGLIRPAYAYPEPITAEAEAALTPITRWRFQNEEGQDVAELLSASPAERDAVADSVLPVRVCWRALAKTDRPITVLLQIIGPENRLIASRRSYPGQGLYPTTIWQEDQAFCDQMHIFIPPDVAETLVYQMEIALIDEEIDRRLAATDDLGEPLGATFVDRLRVMAAGATEEPPSQPAVAGSVIKLASYSLPQRWQIGEREVLTLRWETGEPLPADFQLFVHLRDPSTGEPAAQADGPPLDGWYPTSWWPVGQVIADERTFPIPADLEPGAYDLVVGFYDLATLQPFGGEFRLGTVQAVTK